MDLKNQIERFKVSPNISIWKYLENNRNYPGWNFNASPNTVQEIIHLLMLMEECQYSTSKKMILKKTTDSQLRIPNNRKGLAKIKSLNELVLYSKKESDSNLWKINEIDSRIEVYFGEDKLKELVNSLNRIIKGENDFAISDINEENIIYFW